MQPKERIFRAVEKFGSSCPQLIYNFQEAMGCDRCWGHYALGLARFRIELSESGRSLRVICTGVPEAVHPPLDPHNSLQRAVADLVTDLTTPVCDTPLPHGQHFKYPVEL